MQKAIRRGREDLALRAAATLLRDSTERLWRRCGIIAFEDVGVAALATVGKVVAAFGGKALDMFVREGRSAIRGFLATSCATGRWVRKYIPTDQRVNFVGNLAFAVEGGLLKSRLAWSMGEPLRECAEFECQGSWYPDAREIIALMRADLPLLNKVRAHVR